MNNAACIAYYLLVYHALQIDQTHHQQGLCEKANKGFTIHIQHFVSAKQIRLCININLK